MWLHSAWCWSWHCLDDLEAAARAHIFLTGTSVHTNTEHNYTFARSRSTAYTRDALTPAASATAATDNPASTAP